MDGTFCKVKIGQSKLKIYKLKSSYGEQHNEKKCRDKSEDWLTDQLVQVDGIPQCSSSMLIFEKTQTLKINQAKLQETSPLVSKPEKWGNFKKRFS